MDKDDEKKKKVPDITDLFSLKIFGIDFGEMMKSWLGVADLTALQDPARVEEVKKRIEEQREKLKEAQEQFKKKYGDAIRFDYDIRVRSLLGGADEFRIGGGKFFERLDELARQRAEWRARFPCMKRPPYRITVPREEKIREPLVDIFEEKGEVVVMAEMPGVLEEAIEVKEVEKGLQIKGGEKFFTKVGIPSKVDYLKMAKKYNNGVLEIRLPKVN